MAIQLGHIYEKQTDDRPSTITARAYFFWAFSKLRSAAISDLTEIAASALLRLIQDNLNSFSQLHDEIAEERGHTSKETLLMAYQRFAPDWKALLQMSNAHPLRTALLKWSKRWNLSDEWVLDQAISFLRIFCGRLSEADSSNPLISKKYMEVLTFDAWDDAIRDLKSSADKKSFMLMSFIEFDMELPDFSFTQKGLEFSHSSDDFLLMAGKQIVERKFYTYVRQKQSEGVVISRSIKASFQNTLNLHIRKIKQIAKQHGYIRPPYKEKLDDFTWLIDYLVSDVPSRQTKKQEEIAATYGKPLQTISDGINRAARLLGIKLQGHKRGLKKGQTLKRKPETKEAEATAKAARLPRTIEAITNCANPESNKIVAEKLKISPSHFGRTWKPYVLEQARHILGCPSLTWEEFISRENQQEVRRRLKLR